MSTRSVIIASPSANKAKKIENFTGSTYADLKATSVFRELFTSGVQAILSPGNVTLERDDAQLPTENFKVFLVPTKNKAGMTQGEAREVGAAVQAAILEAVSKVSSDEASGLKKALVRTVEDYFDVDLSSSDCEECDEALADAKRFS